MVSWLSRCKWSCSDPPLWSFPGSCRVVHRPEVRITQNRTDTYGSFCSETGSDTGGHLPEVTVSSNLSLRLRGSEEREGEKIVSVKTFRERPPFSEVLGRLICTSGPLLFVIDNSMSNRNRSFLSCTNVSLVLSRDTNKISYLKLFVRIFFLVY